MDRAFFASVPSSGIDFNSVSITWFVEKNEEEILMDLQKEKEEMEMEKLDAGKYSKRKSEQREWKHCSYCHSDFYQLITLLMSSIESHLSNKPKQVFF